MEKDLKQTYCNQLGTELKLIRYRKQLQQKEAAEKIGIDAANLNRIEKGKHNIRLKTLLQICEAYEIKLKITEKYENKEYDHTINQSLFELC